MEKTPNQQSNEQMDCSKDADQQPEDAQQESQ
jgi:hypothetical protein